MQAVVTVARPRTTHTRSQCTAKSPGMHWASGGFADWARVESFYRPGDQFPETHRFRRLRTVRGTGQPSACLPFTCPVDTRCHVSLTHARTYVTVWRAPPIARNTGRTAARQDEPCGKVCSSIAKRRCGRLEWLRRSRFLRPSRASWDPFVLPRRASHPISTSMRADGSGIDGSLFGALT